MKPYAVVYIWDIKYNLRSKKELSSVYTAGGSNPTWNFKVRFHIDLTKAKENHYALVVKLKSCRKTHGFSDKYIGEVRVLIITELLEGSGHAAEEKIRSMDGDEEGDGDKYSESLCDGLLLWKLFIPNTASVKRSEAQFRSQQSDSTAPPTPSASSTFAPSSSQSGVTLEDIMAQV
nr:protein src2 [Quercus suber]